MNFERLPLIVTDGFEFYQKAIRRFFGPACELCASMVAKLECHLINTQGPVTDPLTEEL